jgi:hypothetical protein
MAEIPIAGSGPALVRLEFYRGDVIRKKIRFTYDLTGCTVRMQIRTTEKDDSALLLELSNTNGGLIVTNGLAAPFPSRVGFRTLTPGEQALILNSPKKLGYFDLQVQFPAEDAPQTFLRGEFVVIRDITR